jgi:hypothetical protein
MVTPPDDIPPQDLRDLAGEGELLFRTASAKAAEYVRAPLPWLSKASACGLNALRVALAVCFTAGLRRRQTDLPITTAACVRFGLGRFGKLAGLLALEKAKLIRVKRANGKNPLVTIIQRRGEK